MSEHLREAMERHGLTEKQKHKALTLLAIYGEDAALRFVERPNKR